MSEVKPFLTYEEQMEKLRSRGCVINDEKECEKILRSVGYYRLSAYFLPFKDADDSYKKDLEFSRIINLYEFDRKLRELLFAAIEVIEVDLRSRLSYFYNDLKTADKKAFAGNDYGDMVSWLRCCTDLRNICAHYGRLYYRIFSAMPSGFGITEAQKRRLWGAMLSVKALFPHKNQWNTEFVPKVKALFEAYADTISLYHIAFPDDWTEQLKNETPSGDEVVVASIIDQI